MGPPLDGGGDLAPAEPGALGRVATSMGPPLDGGGDAALLYDEPDVAHALQWGRRSMAAETDSANNGLQQLRKLQWGRRSMAAETCARP